MPRRKTSPDTPLILGDTQTPGQVDSLQRGLEIMRLFDGGETYLSLPDIASRVGLSRITAEKLLSTLESYNFLRRIHNTENYEAHAACLALGRAAKRGIRAVQIASPHMRRLSDEFDVHVSFMTRERLQMLVLEHCVPAGQQTFRLQTGTQIPIPYSASGRAYLWAQKPTTQAELINALKDTAADKSHRFMQGIYSAYQELEENGWCFVASPVTEQTNSVATPVLDGSDGCRYVLAAMSTHNRVLQETLRNEVAPRLIDLAMRVSQEIQRTGE